MFDTIFIYSIKVKNYFRGRRKFIQELEELCWSGVFKLVNLEVVVLNIVFEFAKFNGRLLVVPSKFIYQFVAK